MSSVVPLSDPATRPQATEPLPAPHALLFRPRLLQRLHDLSSNKICTLIGPIGSGKSVLLAQFRQSSTTPHSLAWLRLEERLNDPHRFLHALSAAIRRCWPGFDGYTALPHHASQPSTASAFTGFILALHHLPHPLHILLDNCEQLDELPWQEQVQMLLELSPDRVKWILAGRHAHAVRTHDWQLRDQWGQIGQNELFFSAQETAVFLQTAVPPANLASVAGQVFQHTRGWPAGVRMARQLLAHTPQSTPADDALFNGKRFSDLCSGLLDTLPPALTTWLVHISVLEPFSAPLCDHLLQTRLSAGYIQSLHQEALLVEATPVPGEFRLHPLLRDTLTNRFQQLPADLRDRTIARACTWLLEQGQRERACALAHRHSQREFLLELVRRCMNAWIKTGHAQPVFEWARILGENSLLAQPQTRFAWCWALTLFGRLVEAENTVRRFLPVADDARMQWQTLSQSLHSPQDFGMVILYGIIRLFQGEMTPSLLELLQRLYLQPSLTPDLRASIDNLYAQHAIHQCHFHTARQRAILAMQMARQTGNGFALALATYLTASASYLNNDLRQALTTCEEYLEQVPAENAHNAHALIDGFHAFLLYQSDQPLRAEARILSLLSGPHPGYSIDLQLYLLVPLIRLKTRRGQFAEARERVQQLQAAAEASGSTRFLAHALFEQIRLACAKGNGNALARLATQANLEEKLAQALNPDHPLQWEVRERWVLAAVLVHWQEERFDQARILTQQLLNLSVDHGYPIRFLPLNLNLAYLELCQGQISAAYRRLNDTLTQADATGLLTGLFDDLPGMDDMVRLALAHRRILKPEHIQRLQTPGLLEAEAGPPPGLSAQEERIAEWLLQDADLEQLATALALSPPAVQWYLDQLGYRLDLVDSPIRPGALTARLRQRSEPVRIP